MVKKRKRPKDKLTRGWPRRVKSAMLPIISLAQYALAYTRGWAANSHVTRVRLKAENDRLRQEVAQLTDEIRIKDTRMARIAASKRPHYAPTELMSILALRAARASRGAHQSALHSTGRYWPGWNNQERQFSETGKSAAQLRLA